MRNRHAVVRAAGFASLGLALLGLPLAAQGSGARLSGLLLTEGSGAPIEGARVALVGLDGAVLRETLSDGRGSFSLRTPVPGLYRLRIARIGYQLWASDTLHIESASESRTLSLNVPLQPIPLPELLVSEQIDCPTTPAERERAFALYGSVLPTLASASSTADLGNLQVGMMRPTVVSSRAGRTFEGDSVTLVVPTSFEEASPAHLETHGYAEVTEGSIAILFAPDGDALSSPGFLATHCLSTVASEDETRVGLAFEPKRGRAVVDVKGVLWIDEDTAEPLEVEFRYTSLRLFLRRNLEAALLEDVRSRLPRRARHLVSFYRLVLDESRFGGVLHFRRLTRDPGPFREWAAR